MVTEKILSHIFYRDEKRLTGKERRGGYFCNMFAGLKFNLQ
jgi:hypothetical protein